MRALRQYRALQLTGHGFIELRNPLSMTQYLLAPHVHLCVTDDHVVLLDLKRDKYVGVGRAQMRTLRQCVRGWPSPQSGESEVANPNSNGSADGILAKMLSAGMLTTDESRGKEARPPVTPLAQSALGGLEAAPGKDPFDRRPAITAGHVINFVIACFEARLALRFRPIASVVARASARKARLSRSRAEPGLELIRERVATYAHLRPLLFTAKDACLFDALALSNYLARYGISATWVFGVQTGPFAAHCWLQHDGVVLNDTPDNVRRYAPILAV